MITIFHAVALTESPPLSLATIFNSSLPAICASNTSHILPQGPIAIFVSGTSGIACCGMVETFARHPKAIHILSTAVIPEMVEFLLLLCGFGIFYRNSAEISVGRKTPRSRSDSYPVSREKVLSLTLSKRLSPGRLVRNIGKQTSGLPSCHNLIEKDMTFERR